MRPDRQLLLCGFLTLAITLPRALLIQNAHTPTLDADEHVDQGLAYLRGQWHPQAFYDPPLGKMVVALPLLAAGCETRIYRHGSDVRRSVHYDQRLSLDTLLRLEAAWKSLLFVPFVMVVFAWCRQLYGTGAGWLVVALFLADPTITGHTPIAALDSLAMQGAIIASYLAWRYIESPTLGRLVWASLATAAALLLKNTLMLLPVGFLVLALVIWLPARIGFRTTVNRLAGAALLTMLFIWALTGFDFSPPAEQRAPSGLIYTEGFDFTRDIITPATTIRWPAGVYLASFIGGFEHTGDGHEGFLWGEFRSHGWWHYYLAVSLYKVPLGIWLTILLAIISVVWVRPRFDELFAIVPAAACATLIVMAGYNVGFRHALPTYGFILMLASRCAAGGSPRFIRLLAWLGVAIAAIHALTYHPDYIVYTNGLSTKPHQAISDSNLDWSQSMKQIARWLDDHPQPGRDVWVDLFNSTADPAIDFHLKGRARRSTDVDRKPRSGVLIVSPLRPIGLYEDKPSNPYAYLWDIEPIDMIGHCLLVYDLDAIWATNTDRTHGTTGH